METTRLAVVSNRLAIVVKKGDDGEWVIKSGSGGLVTALGPVLRDRGGLWIGWLGANVREAMSDGALAELLARGSLETGYTLEPVDLTEEEIQKYYFGFSNEILWALFHDLPSRCNFDPAYWKVYESVNTKFAKAIADNTEEEEDYVWVHDYQLILVADQLKKMGATRHTGFFLHIPFPPLDGFVRLPWRFQILDALLQYDLVGFQTVRDRRNFMDCVRMLVPGTKIVGHGQVIRCLTPTREVLVGTFPISIDFKQFADAAAKKEVEDLAWIIHANLPERQLILGVDRLDYTKGIPHRLHAFANALQRYPEMRRKVTLIQVVVPSRQNVPEYEALKHEIERLVGEINGRFTEVGWTPIHYIYRSLSRVELLAYYRTCEIALVTPLKDGMNLVAKEFCACSIEDNGILILSEFAGAAAQLHHGALLVNPYDIEGVADAIHEAFSMDGETRRTRMKKMRRSIKKNDIFHWVNAYFRAGIAKDLSQFPVAEFFVPKPLSTLSFDEPF
ncbi:MAG: trehalose-6-phosphate synthase [Deltaproteobacteria bacterium RIFOXYD12_FULL_57_12]|nr:MAG: trehalose-6-phosphate synthase [Deltaproteobacteria bacterium RIFOXYD12_FULL_57_12]